MKATEDFPTPDTQKKIREFVGLSNYFRFLLPGFSAHSANLTDLIKNDSTYMSGPLQEEAFFSSFFVGANMVKPMLN